MRIGELARRSGVAVATLRAWERRYGVLGPDRTSGGHRVYGPEDLAQVRLLASRVESGVSISRAARELEQASPETNHAAEAALIQARLWGAVEKFDLAAFSSLVGDGLARWGTARTLDSVVVPTLRRIGEEWREDPEWVAREHFASTALRSLLVNRLPQLPAGPTALAFSPEGERHDLGVVMAAVTLAGAGWYPVVLGADTPWTSVEAVLARLEPDATLVGAQQRGPAARFLSRASLPRHTRLVLGGAGFRAEDAGRIGARFHGGPFAELPGALE